MFMTNENWLLILDFPGYRASDLGRVESMTRRVPTKGGGTRLVPGRILSQVKVGGTKERRYNAVTLYRDGVPHQITVHTLILTTFIGPRPAGTQACHDDDDTNNNALSNLYWGTPKQNAQDMIRNGNCQKSNITHCPQNHEYTPENTYIVPSTGHRQCRACVKAKNKGNANKDRTHCPQQHEYTEENTYRTKDGKRQCRTCVRNRAREYQRAKARKQREEC